MKTQHTPEPWKVTADSRAHIVIDTEGNEICVLESEANARRIVACVNTLKEIKTEWLEQEKSIIVLGAPIADRFREIEAQRDELLAALEACLPHVIDSWDEDHSAVIKARAAIAKARGL